jgi:hypothetical protein
MRTCWDVILGVRLRVIEIRVYGDPTQTFEQCLNLDNEFISRVARSKEPLNDIFVLLNHQWIRVTLMAHQRNWHRVDKVANL